MRKPYRVIVWGPGHAGTGALRELVRRPEFEVVAVLDYETSGKAGKDVGELINHEPIGVKVTTDKEAIIAMDADVVLWTGTFLLPHVVEEMETNVIRLLESGKHVVTPTAFHYAPSHGPAYVKKFEDACRKGKSCLYGTGENPGFWFPQLALMLTGVCSDVEYIKVDEYLDVAPGADYLTAAGYGVPEEEARKSAASGPMAETWKNYYYIESMNLAAMSLWGKPIERFEFEYKYYLAEKTIEYSKEKGDDFNIKIPKGTVKAQKLSTQGYVDGKPKIYDALHWFVYPENSPFIGKVDSSWDIEIEGRPTSVKCTVQALASAKDNLHFRPGDYISPTWYSTVMPCIQAIPIVCSHDPGIVYFSTFTSSVPDFRLLESRKSIVE